MSINKKHWYVIYTKPKNEIKVADRISALGIEAYCPVVIELKQYSDRKKKVKRPLLPSYVLVRIGAQKRSAIFEVPGVVRYVFWLGKPAVVWEEEVERLRQISSGIYQAVEVQDLQRGDSLKIPHGPLQGMTGTVLAAHKNTIRLELPGLGILVTLNRALA